MNNSNANEKVKIRESYKISYKLSYDEAYETFYTLADKFGKKKRIILGIILTLLTIAMLYMQFRTPQAIQYTLLAVVSILLLYKTIYTPINKARRGAKLVASQHGTYKFELNRKGYIVMYNGKEISLKGDKDARAFETPNVFGLRPDRENTLCIPKRILNHSETEGIREILKENYKNFKY